MHIHTYDPLPKITVLPHFYKVSGASNILLTARRVLQKCATLTRVSSGLNLAPFCGEEGLQIFADSELYQIPLKS